MNYVVEVALPPRGYLVRRFIELSAMFLRGVVIKDEKFILTNCMDFHQSLSKLLKELDAQGIRNVFLTGNDRRYTISKMASLLGMDTSSRITTIDLLKALANVVEKRIEGECITKSLIDTSLSTINILKANFYEYGKAYFTKPSERYIAIDKLPMIVQLLGMLGALIADVGAIREENIHYYALPPEGISQDIMAIKQEMILKYFKSAQEVLRRYFNAHRVLLVLKLSTELTMAGCEEDNVIAELISVQEKGNRATVMSIESISTEGLIYLIRSIGTDHAKELATKLGILSDIAVGSLARADKTGNVVTEVAANILTYSRTNSLDALYSAIALIARLSDHVRRDTQEFRYLIDELKSRKVNKPAEWLSRLTALMSALVREG